jgi:hypothetical protein
MISCVSCEAYALTSLLFVGTMAMFEVIAPSKELRVETRGCDAPAGQSSSTFRTPCKGTTVALKT